MKIQGVFGPHPIDLTVRKSVDTGFFLLNTAYYVRDIQQNKRGDRKPKHKQPACHTKTVKYNLIHEPHLNIAFSLFKILTLFGIPAQTVKLQAVITVLFLLVRLNYITHFLICQWVLKNFPKSGAPTR